MRFYQYINEYMKNYPKGWTRDSIKKFVKTLDKSINKSITEEGWFNACVIKMKPKMGDKATGFCASLKDEYMGQTTWRNGDKTIK